MSDLGDAFTRRDFVRTAASATATAALLTGSTGCETATAAVRPRDPRAVPVIDLEVAEAAELLRAGDLSATDLATATLERIRAVEGRVEAFAHLYPEDEILAQARAADDDLRAGRHRGPLHGITVGLKDLFFTQGKPTEGNSDLYRGFIPDYDATVVARLKAMGAVIVGKTATQELATAASAPTRNPWDLRRSPGGSSSGSAAGVAASEFMVGMGTETRGSIRGPAGNCGVTGFKPTYGTISLYGVFPLAWSVDHAGHLARSALDAALVADAVAGSDPLDPRTRPVARYTFTDRLRAARKDRPLEGVVVGVPSAGHILLEVSNAEELEAFRAAVEVLRAQGAEVRTVSPQVILPGLTSPDSFYVIIRSAEVAAVHREDLLTRPQSMSAAYLGRVSSGLLMPAHAYLYAQQVRRIWREQLHAVFDAIDVLVHPVDDIAGITGGGGANGTPPGRASLVRGMWSSSGAPAVAILNGFSAAERMPLSMQCAAAPGNDDAALLVAHAFQLATDHHRMRPTIA